MLPIKEFAARHCGVPMLSIDECWAFLESRGDALTGLPPGATSEAISDAEALMHVEFPDDLRKLLLRHDGCGSYYISPYKIGGGGQTFMPIKDIIATWKCMTDIGADFARDGEFGEQTGPIKRNYWNMRWIPITDNGCGDNIIIDLDPPEEGTLGQIVDWGHEGGVTTFQATSLREWLNEVVEEVRAGVCNFHSPKAGAEPWKYKIVVENVSARLGTIIEHPHITAAGLKIRIEEGPTKGRSIKITAEGDMRSLSCCEYELLNGEERLDSYSFASNYNSGVKRITMSSATNIREGATLVIKCGEV